jgi:hypothetical protein
MAHDAIPCLFNSHVVMAHLASRRAMLEQFRRHAGQREELAASDCEGGGSDRLRALRRLR